MKNKAFTLIEVLVAVLIIGILAAIAVPKYQEAVEKSIMQEAIANLKTIAQANDSFYLQNGRYAYSYEIDKLDISIPGEVYTGSVAQYKNRIKTNTFMYAPDGDDGSITHPQPSGYKAIATRLPIGSTYAIILKKDNKLACIYVQASASAAQKKLCNKMGKDGHL